MEGTMKILRITKKGSMMNTRESFHMYKENRLDKKKKKKCTVKYNHILNTIIKKKLM
jgi:hypothetical protein